MIDIGDPSLNPVPIPPAADVQTIEPIKPETVSVKEERLEDRKAQEEELQERRKKRRRGTDSVEISIREESSQETDERLDTVTAEGGQADEHKINFSI